MNALSSRAVAVKDTDANQPCAARLALARMSSAKTGLPET
jgi:hypothetical protein